MKFNLLTFELSWNYINNYNYIRYDVNKVIYKEEYYVEVYMCLSVFVCVRESVCVWTCMDEFVCVYVRVCLHLYASGCACVCI